MSRAAERTAAIQKLRDTALAKFANVDLGVGGTILGPSHEELDQEMIHVELPGDPLEMRVDLGEIWLTAGVKGLARACVVNCIERHRRGDWGSVESEDAKRNDGLACTGRPGMLSTYVVEGEEIWISTHFAAGRPGVVETVVMLPEEY